MTSELDKKAQRGAAVWLLIAVAAVTVAITADHLWLRIFNAAITIVAAFFAGLIVLPDEKAQR